MENFLQTTSKSPKPEPPHINLAIAINRNYVKYAYVMLYSFLTHHTCPSTVFVMHRDLLPEDMDTLRKLSSAYPILFHFIHVPDTLTPPADVLATSAWGAEAYFRLAITDLIPADIDRILYLDTDMIINRPIHDMYFIDFEGRRLAACKEYFCTAPFHSYRDELFKDFISGDFYYFNSGTILYNLAALRQDCSFHSYMELARKLNYQIQFPDQDLLNYRHHNEVLYLDTTYNLNARYGYNYYHMRYENMKSETAIIHYASSKPWRGNFVHCDVEQIWWDYAADTPFYDEFLAGMVRETIMDTQVTSYFTNLQIENDKLYQQIEHYGKLLENAGISI